MALQRRPKSKRERILSLLAVGLFIRIFSGSWVFAIAGTTILIIGLAFIGNKGLLITQVKPDNGGDEGETRSPSDRL